MSSFDDPDAVANYAEGPPRLVPGFADMQRMTLLLLSESAPADARILVLGAGGGLELKYFAGKRPGWRFDGVDPSPAMLALARTMLGRDAERAALHEGFIDAAPDGPFDGACALLALHFVPEAERRRTLREIRRRLKPGAPFIPSITVSRGRRRHACNGCHAMPTSRPRPASIRKRPAPPPVR